MDSPKLIDNLNCTLCDAIKNNITAGSSVSIAASSFSLHAFAALREVLQDCTSLRILFTQQAFTDDQVPDEAQEKLSSAVEENSLRNELTQKALAIALSSLIKARATFKSNISGQALYGFVHIGNDDPKVYLPLMHFTAGSLGLTHSQELCSLMPALPNPQADQYLRIFNELWNSRQKTADVTVQVLRRLEELYKENAPEDLYYISLFHILKNLDEDTSVNEKTGIKNSVIWRKLYNFQRDAVLSIISRLEKYHGCILADSVGLGKTYTALAVIKYYELRNRNVLVLCPKKLNENWMEFRSNYQSNPLSSDRLRYDILFHTDLGRDHGESNGISLEKLNWSNYDLVVIDESHNFRNGGRHEDQGSGEEHKDNRYDYLMNRVMRQGVKTHVLMLSATPVNNRFSDLKNQLRLACEGHSFELDARLHLKHGIEEIFRQAQIAYNRWEKMPANVRTAKKLIGLLDFDFFNLLDAVTIARSRKHIAKYYDTSMIGSFPSRLPPITRCPPLTDHAGTLSFGRIASILLELSLAIYTPSLYLLPSAKKKYHLEYDGISIDGREKGLRKLMAVNLLKRLESSVNSFRLTVQRIHNSIKETIALIDSYQKDHGMATITASEFISDEQDEDLATFGTKKSTIMLADLDRVSYRRDLMHDQEKLAALLLSLKDVGAEHDSKLASLKDDLREKFTHPFNGHNRKVLIFTAFADTAEYLYQNLASWVKNNFDLETALVTGSGSGKCTIKEFRSDYSRILTWFSPMSKERQSTFPEATTQIDLLIATDCISEGQNLQDCDQLINYDIHWNPVRIIQRFGRIDRIGSKNSSIRLINYWPDMQLDEYINLKARVESRMTATVITGSGDDDPLSSSAQEDLDYRRVQLEKLQHEVVDLEDIDGGISIMDLGLNELRMDLGNSLQSNPTLRCAPMGLYAVIESSDELSSGVLFVLKKLSTSDDDHLHPLHPYYLVHVAEDGSATCDDHQPRRMLDLLRQCTRGKKVPNDRLCAKVNRETHNGERMGKYTKMLKRAVDCIVKADDESDIMSLFSEGETTALRHGTQNIDDFELISWFVIKEGSGKA